LVQRLRLKDAHRLPLWAACGQRLMDEEPLTIPPFLRGLVRQKMAVGRLRKAAQALLDEEAECAQGSYREYDHANKAWVWNDQVWKRGDPEHFKLCREVRLALRELRLSEPMERVATDE
jgi:hypothetical protein